MAETAGSAINLLCCQRCSEGHDLIACPHVKAVEYAEGGRITRVEFLTPADYGPPPKDGAPGAEPEASYPRRPNAG